MLEKETSSLFAARAKNDSLKRLLGNAVPHCPAKKSWNLKEYMLGQKRRQHIVIVPVILESFNVCCARETCKPKRLRTPEQRHRERFAAFTGIQRNLANFISMATFYSRNSIISSLKHNSSPFDGEQRLLKLVFLAELSRPDWSIIYVPDSQKQDCINVATSDKKMMMNFWQALCAELSFSRWSCFKFHFKELGRFCLQSICGTYWASAVC